METPPAYTCRPQGAAKQQLGMGVAGANAAHEPTTRRRVQRVGHAKNVSPARRPWCPPRRKLTAFIDEVRSRERESYDDRLQVETGPMALLPETWLPRREPA